VAEWKAKVEDVVKKVQAAGEPGKAVNQLENSLEQVQELREAALKRSVKACKALEKAEKEKGKLQVQVDEQAKRVAEGLNQQKVAAQIQVELAREKQTQAEVEGRITEANQTRAAAAAAMAGLKQKLSKVKSRPMT